jgi:hypothetical protein
MRLQSNGLGGFTGVKVSVQVVDSLIRAKADLALKGIGIGTAVSLPWSTLEGLPCHTV